MENMTRLLTKQLKTLSIFALFVLLCSIPAYYYVVDLIWLEELDEHNELIKERIENKFSTTEFSEDKLNEVLKLWNVLQPSTNIVVIDESKVREDFITEAERENEFEKGELDRYRILTSFIKINDKNYQLTVETNVEEAGETMAIIGLVTIFFFVILLLGFILINKRISLKIWQPFQTSLKKLKAFRLSDETKIAFDKTAIKEFAELNTELEQLISNNIEAYQRQKRFIENASHELQTPLAVLKSKLDLLLQSEDLTEKQSEIINAVALPLSRMTRLNKNLLILAKIENEQFSEKENLNLKNSIHENLELLEDYIKTKELKIELEVEPNYNLSANKFLLETLLSNMLTNAIKYSDTISTIKIKLTENLLKIINPGTQSLNQETLFDRFAVVSSSAINSGLGLAIVKETCLNNDWKITYSFDSNEHVFTIQF